MLPVVVASTNQYLAMISCISVTGQFQYMGTMNCPYAAYIGFFTLVAAYIGITQVNRIVKITGRQSIIVSILAVVLVISCLSLPLKYLL